MFIAEDFLKYGIRKQQAALQVAHGDAHASVFVNRPEPFLALPEHLFRALAFGDVLADADPASVFEVNVRPRRFNRPAVPCAGAEIRPFRLAFPDE